VSARVLVEHDTTLATAGLSNSGKLNALGVENFAHFNTEDHRIGSDAFINQKKPGFAGR